MTNNISNTTSELAPVAGSEELKPRQQLDIVQDCADLAGTFPANVELNFVYWAHGTNHDGESSSKKAARIAPHLMEAGVIGIEVAGTIHQDSRHVEQEFAIINSLLNGDLRHQKLRDAYGGIIPTSALILSIELVKQMRKLGRTSTPKFFPFDVFEPIAANKARGDHEYNTADDYIRSQARLMRHREHVTLRQLHNQATTIAADGRPHQIAVLYGSAHTTVSVATQTLGAPTSRVFVDPPIINAMTQYERAYRYKPEAALAEPDLEKLDQAIHFGVNLGDIAELVKYKRLAHKQRPVTIHSLARLYTSLYLRTIERHMTSPQLLTFIDSTELVAKAIDSPNGLKFRRNLRVRKQLKRLDALVVELHMA